MILVLGYWVLGEDIASEDICRY